MTRYSRVAIILHWLMALMIIGNLAGGFLHDFIPRGSPERTLVMGLHASFGLTLIALTLVRLGWRLAIHRHRCRPISLAANVCWPRPRTGPFMPPCWPCPCQAG